MNRNKLPFWQLSFMFLMLASLTLLYLWHNYQAEESGMMTQMMGQNMGDMMRMMHASNISLSDLLIWNQDMGQSGNMHDQGGYLRWVYDFSTTVIFLVTPLIVAMTMLLLIVWNLR